MYLLFQASNHHSNFMTHAGYFYDDDQWISTIAFQNTPIRKHRVWRFIRSPSSQSSLAPSYYEEDRFDWIPLDYVIEIKGRNKDVKKTLRPEIETGFSLWFLKTNEKRSRSIYIFYTLYSQTNVQNLYCYKEFFPIFLFKMSTSVKTKYRYTF